MKRLTIPTLIALTAFLSNCTTVQRESPSTAPEFDIPADFRSIAAQEAPGSGLQSGWLEIFNDTKLNALVKEVLVRNFDLRIAAAKIEAAAALAKQAGADLSPAVILALQGTNQGNMDSALSEDISSVGVSLDIAWELDVWGRIRSGQRAAIEELVAAKMDYAYARLSLVAQTTKAYFLAIETLRQQQLAENNVANYVKTLEIVKAFFDEGMVSVQDVYLVRSEKAVAEDALGNAQSAHLQALRSLETLLGRYPSAAVDIAGDLPGLPAPVPAGIPSEVLERRPDIIAAERRVAAAFDETREAKAARLPSIDLTGSLGSVSDGLSDLTNPANIAWNVVSSLMFPFFDAGRLEGRVEAAEAFQKQALADYQKTALAAFGEIETALSNETIFRRRAESLKIAYKHARLAEEISIEKYKMGEGELLDVLQLQRSTISTQSAYLRMEYDLLVQRVNLYLGLGGGF